MDKIIRYGWYEYKKRIIESNVKILLVFVVLFLNMALRPLVNASYILGTKIPIGTVYFTLTDTYILTVVELAIIIFYSFMLFEEKDMNDIFTRVNILEKYFGKIIAVLLNALTISGTFAVISIALIIMRVGWFENWDVLNYTLSVSNVSSQIEGLFSIPYYVLNEYSMLEMIVYEEILLFLLSFFIGIFVVSMQILDKGFVAVVVLLIFLFFANAIPNNIQIKMTKYSLFSWLSLDNLTKGSEPYLLNVFVAMGILIFLSTIFMVTFSVALKMNEQKKR